MGKKIKDRPPGSEERFFLIVEAVSNHLFCLLTVLSFIT